MNTILSDLAVERDEKLWRLIVYNSFKIFQIFFMIM